jgi:hypothetical protein
MGLLYGFLICFLPGILACGVPGRNINGGRSSETNESDRIITVERTGGIAGLHRLLSINPDGTILDEKGNIKREPPQNIERFVRQIQKAAIVVTSPISSPTINCSDCFVYRITINGKGGPKLMIWIEPPISTTSSNPETIQMIQAFLHRMFDQST